MSAERVGGRAQRRTSRGAGGGAGRGAGGNDTPGREMPCGPDMRCVLLSGGITRARACGWGVHATGGTRMQRGRREGRGHARLRRPSNTHHLHRTLARLHGRVSACATSGWAWMGAGGQAGGGAE